MDGLCCLSLLLLESLRGRSGSVGRGFLSLGVRSPLPDPVLLVLEWVELELVDLGPLGRRLPGPVLVDLGRLEFVLGGRDCVFRFLLLFRSPLLLLNSDLSRLVGLEPGGKLWRT